MQIRKNRSTILLFVTIMFAVYCFVVGDSGLLERMKLEDSKKEINNSISGLNQENQRLTKEYAIISDSRTNKEFYKEEASKSGYISNNEKYLFFKEKEKKSGTEAAAGANKYPVEISHLRILWIAASVIVLFFYFVKRNKEKKREKENADNPSVD